jgi:valyl-tRNA synthetase
MEIPEKLLKPYNPAETEDRIYKLWEESGFFSPEACIKAGMTDKNAPAFSIVLPPPNVTGELHMGHASMLAIEDIMVRFERMRGKRTLWIPGTDHAAIATQSKVEKILEKEEGKKRRDLGREEFLKRVEDFARKSHDTIVNQVKKMGSSLDWSREAFTLDEKRTLAVRTAFKQMHDLGLIYRGDRVVNWDPKGQTVISDDEVVHEERKGKLYTFKYSKDFPISISTSRPETKVGDTAVAVHPKDERYKKFIGHEYDIDFAGAKIHIKIIADDKVEMEFGTGALGVTPAHSIADWEMAQRHDLPLVQVINEFAKMTAGSPEIIGKKTAEARELIVEWLKKENLLEKEEEITQNISTAERTGAVIEPLPKLQWFVAVNKKFKIPHSEIKGVQAGAEITLKELMLKSVESGQIKIIPDHFEKTYFHWIENLRDWCISRQIWYGHRIPVWYKDNETYMGIEAPEGAGWTQDEDTLDTWFSSGLWTFSTLGWPEQTADLKTYHPTAVLETGYDILFFWIARMILMSSSLLGQVPFRTVYLHGLVRDGKGRKISKSLGNNIDPLEIIGKYGADAARMSLIIGTAPGNDSKVSDEKLKAYKHFANKIWNITRFVLENTDGANLDKPEMAEADEELISELGALAAETTGDIENFRFYLAGEKIYHYLWSRFADVILEDSKKIFKEGTPAEQASRRWALGEILRVSVRLLHPFMPYVTEELWSMIPQKEAKNLLMVENWPK